MQHTLTRNDARRSDAATLYLAEIARTEAILAHWKRQR